MNDALAYVHLPLSCMAVSDSVLISAAVSSSSVFNDCKMCVQSFIPLLLSEYFVFNFVYYAASDIMQNILFSMIVYLIWVLKQSLMFQMWLIVCCNNLNGQASGMCFRKHNKRQMI